MLAKLASYTLVGIDATTVDVEVDVSYATMPKVVLVGLAETAVKESTHRVERAVVNSGYRRPIDRVVINLAPADLKKDAGGFDLPIALGLLLGSGQVSYDRPGPFAVVGELALTGEARPIKGLLADESRDRKATNAPISASDHIGTCNRFPWVAGLGREAWAAQA
jgi:magnesium chelatase family protein